MKQYLSSLGIYHIQRQFPLQFHLPVCFFAVAFGWKNLSSIAISTNAQRNRCETLILKGNLTHVTFRCIIQSLLSCLRFGLLRCLCNGQLNAQSGVTRVCSNGVFHGVLDDLLIACSVSSVVR